MIDTGCELNLLKESCIQEKIRRDETCIYYLTGIGKGMQKTHGFVILKIFDTEVEFHLVHDKFSVSSCGILGMNFLRTNFATMSFSDERITLKLKPINCNQPKIIYLPARTRKLVSLQIENQDLKEGYLERINTGEGVFIGENLVKNNDGMVQVYAINSTLHDIELIIPPIKLFEYETTIHNIQTLSIEESLQDEKFEEHPDRLTRIMNLLNFQDLNDEEINSLLGPFSEFSYRFFLDGDKLGSTNVIMHKIHTTDETPTFQRQYRPAEIHNEEILKQTDKLLESNFIEDSDSPFNSPVWIVPKKPDEKGNKLWRMVIDYRQLNEKTISDAYPLPNITHILDQLGGAQYFSTLDLASGFHQVKMHPESKAKTAFSTPFGHYHFNRMPFGLKNAPATFQRLMDKVLSGLQGVEIFVYMDDIVIYAHSLEEHTRKLKNLLQRLERANLTLQPEKCKFLKKEVAYLGHVISREGVKPDPKKVEAVRKFPRPRNPKNVKQFLGLAGYYRRFIPKFSIIAKPLSHLLKKGVRFAWTSGQQEAFDKLKNIMCSFPLLQYPDFKKPFTVSTDASNYGIGGVLSQKSLNLKGDLPIAYASRTLTDTEINYSTIEKELLAILFCVETFRPYLYGRRFKLETDHRPLVWLHNVKNPGSKLLRWRLRLSEYDYDIVYKKGVMNSNADALSRNPSNEIIQINFDVNNDSVLPISEVDPLDSSFQKLHKVLVLQNLPPVYPDPIYDPVYDTIGRNIEEAFLRTEVYFSADNELDNCTPVCEYNKIDKSPDASDESYEVSDIKRSCVVFGRDVVENACVYEDKVPVKNSCVDEDKVLVYENACVYEDKVPVKNSCVDEDKVLVYENAYVYGDKVPVKNSCVGEDKVLVCFGTDDFVDVVTEVKRCEIDSKNIKINEKESCKLPNDVDSESDLDLFDSHFFEKNDNSVLKEILIIESNQSSQNYKCFPLLTEILSENENPINGTETNQITNDDELMTSDFQMTCLRTCKDKLYMRNDHLVLFIPADCKLTTETGQELLKENRINYDDLKNELPENLKVGNVIVHKYNHLCVFYLIIKQNFDSKTYMTHILDAFIGLKYAMNELKLNHFSISRIGNGLNQISWPLIENELRKTFGNGDYTITICDGQIEIPTEADRLPIIEEYHCSTVGGHKGANKTYNRIREQFYWTNMREEVRNFVRKCEMCKRNKLVRIKTKLPMRITDTPSEAFEKIEIDIVGPLPETEHNNKYILTIQDNLTKYSDAIPLKNTQSTTIALAFAEHFISRFGCPQIIHTDQGSDFTSQVMSTFCKIFKIKQIKSTAFHPQSLGSLERSHHVLIQYLKNYCQKNNWDRWLRFALFSYNTSEHEGTGFTPHELIFGKRARIPSEFANGKIPLTYNLFLKTLNDKLIETQSKANERLQQAKEKSKKYYDQKLNSQNYEIGESVYLLNNAKNSKLDVQYQGPFKIVNIFNDHNVELNLGNGKTKIVHMNCLRPQTIKICYN